MKTLLICDSSCDLSDELLKSGEIVRAPYTINCGGNEYLDDENMDVDALLADISSSADIAQTAAVSPRRFIEAVGDADQAIIVTITSRLSSSYSNACLAAKELEEKGKRVHVIDSKAAGAGETAVAMKVKELLDRGMPFDEIVAKGEEIVKDSHIYFILDDYSTLIKSGRLPKLAGRLLSSLSIKPIAYGSDGVVEINGIARGMSSAIKKLADRISKLRLAFEERSLYISYVENKERAREVKEKILEKCAFKNVEIMRGSGLVTTYANRGGILVGL